MFTADALCRLLPNAILKRSANTLKRGKAIAPSGGERFGCDRVADLAHFVSTRY